ncbi:MAG: RNA polymerase sigma factor [Phycisphaerales bacterium JB038]
MLDDIDLTACLHGDKRAWDGFVERSAGVIYAAVQKVRGNRGRQGAVDVDDIVQEVFTKLVREDYRLLRQFNPQKASLVTYLTLIARSTTLDALKRRQLDTTELTPAQHPVQEQARVAGGAVGSGVIPIDALSERQRLILHLLFDREMSVVEVAAALGVDPQTVRSGKHKALTKLRETLATGDASQATVVEPQ